VKRTKEGKIGGDGGMMKRRGAAEAQPLTQTRGQEGWATRGVLRREDGGGKKWGVTASIGALFK
jgi:hypothetical protein